MTDTSRPDVQGGLTDEQKRANVIRLAFAGSLERYNDIKTGDIIEVFTMERVAATA